MSVRRHAAVAAVAIAATAAVAGALQPEPRAGVRGAFAAAGDVFDAIAAAAEVRGFAEPWSGGTAAALERGRRTPASSRAPAAQELMPNVPYDGSFTFVRLRYDMPLSRFGGGFGGRFGGCYTGRIAWLHDYPCAERNLAHILNEVTKVVPYLEGGNILAVDDPDLFKYPIAYMSEPGYWRPTEREAQAMREYLLKGGFMIFDDFGGRDWYPFEAAVRMALPEYELVRLDGSEPIFSSFFSIAPLETIAIPYRGGAPEWWGVYEDNDRTRRLMLVASFNNDLGDFWEYSGTGWYPMDLSNEALKIGVNYMIYAMIN
jgi:hypothetical protein